MSHNRCSCHPFSSSSKIPVGYHFMPTEKQVKDFLKEKNKNPEFSPQPIVTCNIYEFNPDELASKFSAEEEDMYFFTQLNVKNDGALRANRQAKDGFWVNKDGRQQGNSIGCQKTTLNFYKGVTSKGKKSTDWLMKEYSLEVEPPTMGTTTKACSRKGKRVAETQDDNPKKMKNYVLCQIYKKREKTDKKKRVAEKTTEDFMDEVITEERATYFTPDQPNNINNERLPTTPGMQIYPREDMFTDIDWEEYDFASDQF